MNMDSKKEKYYKSIVNSLLRNTIREVKNGRNNNIISIWFPMYKQNYELRYTYDEIESNKRNRGNTWSIGSDDIEYLETKYGLRKEEHSFIIREYWYQLCVSIIDDLYE